MGIIVMFTAVAVFAVSLLIGAIALGIFLFARKRGRGRWGPFFALFVMGGLCCVAVAGMYISSMPESRGAPTAEQMEAIMMAVMALASFPAVGSWFGLGALMFRHGPTA